MSSIPSPLSATNEPVLRRVGSAHRGFATLGGRAASPARERRGATGLKRTAAVLGLVAVLGCGYLAGGFIRFTQEVAQLATPQRVERSDGIVVLTGGALRLDQAVDLLKTGRAERLLISGVNPGTSIAALSKLTGMDREWFDCCVDLDYAALNTIGNAEMTERWAKSRGFDELILVTSDYHMPRTLLEFGRWTKVPVIRPYPVARADLWSDRAIPSGFGLKVLLTEYAKLLAARIRLATGLEGGDAVMSVSTAHSPASRRG